MRDLGLRCPYCGMEFFVPAPKDINEEPCELECLPYTRDIGRFDEKGWSLIGQDFFGRVLGWERIGILRSVSKMEVWYQVPRCPDCGELFDVYANYSCMSLENIWPHLFRREEGALPADDIKLYFGKTSTERMISLIAKKLFLSNKLLSMVFVSASLYLLSVLPFWVEAKSLPLLLEKFGLELLTRVGGAICLVFVFLQFDSYVSFLREESDFHRLLKVQDRRGVTFWKNFSLCRFIGVQENNAKISIRQVSLVSGLPMVLLFLIVWFLNFGDFGVASVISVALFLAFLLGTLVENTYFAKNSDKRISSIFSTKKLIAAFLPIRWGGIIGCVVIALAGVIFCLFELEDLLRFFQEVSSLLFWTVIIYYISTAAWVSFNTSTYVLRGLAKVPMNLSPLNGFYLSEALDRIANFAINANLLVSVFVVFVAAVSVTENYLGTFNNYSSVNLLFGWVTWALGFLFVVLLFSKAINISSFFFVGIAYLMFLQFVDGYYIQFSIQKIVVLIYYKTILVGAFLSYLIYIHHQLCHTPIESVKKKYKEIELDRCDYYISYSRNVLDQLAVFSQTEYKFPNLFFAIQKNLLWQQLQNAVSLSKLVKETSVSPNTSYSVVAKVVTPFLSSFLISMILDFIKNKIFELIP